MTTRSCRRRNARSTGPLTSTTAPRTATSHFLPTLTPMYPTASVPLTRTRGGCVSACYHHPCPHTTIYVSACYYMSAYQYICVRTCNTYGPNRLTAFNAHKRRLPHGYISYILSAYYCMCPHTSTLCVHILLSVPLTRVRCYCRCMSSCISGTGVLVTYALISCCISLRMHSLAAVLAVLVY